MEFGGGCYLRRHLESLKISWNSLFSFFESGALGYVSMSPKEERKNLEGWMMRIPWQQIRGRTEKKKNILI